MLLRCHVFSKEWQTGGWLSALTTLLHRDSLIVLITASEGLPTMNILPPKMQLRSSWSSSSSGNSTREAAAWPEHWVPAFLSVASTVFASSGRGGSEDFASNHRFRGIQWLNGWNNTLVRLLAIRRVQSLACLMWQRVSTFRHNKLTVLVWLFLGL